ncbi:MAG: putative phosphothreonine lyase domain-containing protein [Chloroflexota bacterium]
MSDNKPSKLDMDIINMVQNARMQHDNDAVPSKVPGVYWIEAKAPAEHQQATARAGEFKIETDVDTVDAQWAVIKQATENAELGYKSKVSTSPTDGTPHGKQRLIIVKTYDADDREDMERVRAKLEALGFENVSFSE